MEGCDGLIYFNKKLITLTDFYDSIEYNDKNKINYIESRMEKNVRYGIVDTTNL